MKNPVIDYRKFPETYIASIRTAVHQRSEIIKHIENLKTMIEPSFIAGSAFIITYFVTSVADGDDMEICIPLKSEVKSDLFSTRLLPSFEVLSLVHQGPISDLGKSYQELFQYGRNNWYISDEFGREVFIDSDDPLAETIEIQLIIHNWNKLLSKNLERVLGPEVQEELMDGHEKLPHTISTEEQYNWLSNVIDRLDERATKDQKYDILSSCSHIFPQEIIDRGKEIFRKALAENNSFLDAIDSTIQFMGKDHGWGDAPVREGYVLYVKKSPANPQKYKDATTREERRKAYCFCLMVQEHLNDGLSPTFCNCGTGWFRRQWESILDHPVKIQILHSVLKGDEECKFAIHLPQNLPMS